MAVSSSNKCVREGVSDTMIELSTKLENIHRWRETLHSKVSGVSDGNSRLEFGPEQWSPKSKLSDAALCLYPAHSSH